MKYRKTIGPSRSSQGMASTHKLTLLANYWAFFVFGYFLFFFMPGCRVILRKRSSWI